MTTMRSAKDIRTMVTDARQMNGSSLQQAATLGPEKSRSMRPQNVPFDLQMDADIDIAYASTSDDVKSKKLQVLQQVDKDNVEVMKKQLISTRQELEDLKQKFGALKRNYDAISQHAAKDNVEYVRLQKMKDEYDNKLTQMQASNSKLTSDFDQQKKLQEEAQRKVKEVQLEVEGKNKEIDQMKKEFSKKEKMTQQSVDQLNAANKHLFESTGKLKNDIDGIRKTSDKRQERVEELEKQISMAGDSVNLLMIMQKQLVDKDLALNNYKEESSQLKLILSQLEAHNGQLGLKVADLQAKVQSGIEVQEQMRQQIRKLERDLLDAQQKCTAVLEELALLKGLGSDASSDLRKVLQQKADIEHEYTDYKGKQEILHQSLTIQLRKTQEQITELQLQLSKYKAEIERMQKQMGSSDSDKERMAKELYALKAIVEQAQSELKMLQSLYASTLQKTKDLEYKLEDSLGQVAQLTTQLATKSEQATTFQTSSQKYQQMYTREKEDCDKLTTLKNGLLAGIEKLKAGQLAVEQILSCLSCLEFLKEPALTLVCGHSICKTCFNKHSDPKSKDSLVFCEECKVETKNKQLCDRKFVNMLSSKVNAQKLCFESVIKLLPASK